VTVPPGGLPHRPNRRATDGGRTDTPRARQRRLVAHISGDPELVAWLATSKARTLHGLAAELAGAGHRDAAEIVSRRARELADGTASPF
jgi:hypothetical protein